MKNLLVATLCVMSLACGLEAPSSGSQQQRLTEGPAVDPVLIPNDNPTCADLGYAYGFKIDNVNGPFSGTYTSSDGYLTVTGSSVDGVSFSFTSNVGVDVVLMKGGNAANAYTYSPETTGDSNLVSPINASGGPAAISHVTFCYDFEVRVTKTASTSLTRDFNWALAKSTTTSSLLLSTGQSQLVPYVVTASVTGSTDSSFAVAGTITVSNPAPMAATLEGVTDAMGAITAPVDCGQAFPLTLAPGASVTCTYAASLPDATTRTNVATVTTSGSVGGNTGSATVDFAAAAVTTVDDCVTVTDSMVGALGSACVASAPQAFSYTAEVGPFTATGCGIPFAVTNVATLSAPSGEACSASAVVPVTVACPGIGCTLTQGYWKTHSSYGPARYDDAWAQLPQGADTAFFSTNMSWYQVLWTPPAGNAYFVLAHQYAAAVLNGLNGADTTAVTSTLAAAKVILETSWGVKMTTRTRNDALRLATTLDQYNNGLIGPGHCSE